MIEQNGEEQSKRQSCCLRKCRFLNEKSLTLVLLISVFILPVVGAYYFFYSNSNLTPTSYGQLIKPPIKIGLLRARTADGERYDFKMVRGKWLMLLMSARKCDSACLFRMERLDKLKRALGRDGDRVQYFLVTQKEQAPVKEVLYEKAPKATLLLSNGSDIKGFFQIMPNIDAYDQGLQTIIVDPHGNVILYYDIKAKARGILKDVKHLLKVSRIG